MSPEPVGYRFGPLEQRGLLAGLRAGQILFLAGGVAASLGIVGSMRSLSALVPVVVVAGAALAAASVRLGSRTPDRWLPLVVRHLWRRLRGRSRFVSEAPVLGHTIGGGPPTAAPDTLRGVSLLSMATNPALPPAVPSGIGILKDARAGTYTGVLQVRGRAFALLDAADQARVVEAWASILAGFGRERSPVRRLQWIERTLPDTGADVASHLGESMRLSFADEAVRAYLGLIEENRPATQRHDVLVAVQIDRTRAAAALRQHRDPDVGAYAVLARELEALSGRLQAAGLQVEGALPPRALAQVIRLTFEPAARAGLALRTANQGAPGVQPASMWPLATSTGWSRYRVESAWHTVYWVREWPRTPVGPDFLAPLLLQTRSMRTVSMVMEPIPPLRARREVEAARMADASDEHVRQRAGFVTSIRRRREHEQVLARERELADGHSDVRFSAYVLVSGGSEQELEAACAEVEQQAGQARLELCRLDGDQEVAFTYCLPLGRGLR
jgi:hypothetical protein